ncbi:TetR/AcrR family transcriptional regulator [Noviherbaspirillum saxi]|uniref:TetR/AcrR family transcriptional regulator n=1 Tax=Noviherbaspirillum saxi TaxID=2320863 RepID=A0A3A3FQM5_9BURK|nr:TetR/AcrR family transcriptional regulator [Noviherbaspirillum saxi]RJF95762.1 TetR/AcrR family transcriptional regulator [Noviherbaspirillum saxi]
MRTKSETRRQAILKAASEIFRETGFERTSMETICKHVGYSKATLYSYFPSKEELFLEVVMEATEAEFQANHAALDPTTQDIKQALNNFGIRLLTLLYSPQVQAVRRLVVSEAGRSDLGKKCFELGPVRSQAAVAEFLHQAMEKGQLRRANPHVASLHLKGLLEAEWLDRFIFQMLGALTAKEITESVDRAISVFMAAYGVLDDASKQARTKGAGRG